MLEIRKAVVGVAIDEEGRATPGSRRALERASTLAKAAGAHLELLHAAPWMAANSPDAPRTPRERKDRERQARDVLQELERELQLEGVEASALLVPRTPHSRPVARRARSRLRSRDRRTMQ